MKEKWKKLIAGLLCGALICTSTGLEQAVQVQAAEHAEVLEDPKMQEETGIPTNAESDQDNRAEDGTTVDDDGEEPGAAEGEDEDAGADAAEENSTISDYLGGYDEEPDAVDGSSNIILSGNCGADGDNVKFVLDSDGVLTISGSGEMPSYSYPSFAPWYKERTSIKTAVVETGVTNIRSHAFYGCSWLTSISLPESVTSIGYYAFCGCSGLTSISLPESVTSISDFAFEDCWHLTSISFPKSVTYIGYYAFYRCDGLTSIQILNSACTITDSLYTLPENAAIYGYAGSTAESYAKTYNRTFISFESLESDVTLQQFTLTQSAAGMPDNVINISGSLGLSGGELLPPYIVQKAIDGITWTSSDPSVAEVTECGGEKSSDNRMAALSVSIMPHKVGTTTITGTASTGQSASCEVTVAGNELFENIAELRFAANSVKGSVGQRSIGFSGRISLKDGAALAQEEWDNIVKSISWSSSNPFVAGDVTCKYLLGMDNLGLDKNSANHVTLIIGVQPKAAGTATVTGVLPGGHSAGFKVTVTEGGGVSSDLGDFIVKKEEKDPSYGTPAYQSTLEGKIYEEAVKLNTMMDRYLAAVRDAADKDLQDLEKKGESEGTNFTENLKKDKIFSLDATMPKEAEDSVYRAYEEYVKMHVDKGVELGKIDLKKHITHISVELVNSIRKGMTIEEITYKDKDTGYIVNFKVTGMWNASHTEVCVSRKRFLKREEIYYGSIDTTPQKTAQVMVEYIDALSDIVEDLLVDSLNSIMKELSEVSGAAEFAKEMKGKLESFLGDGVQALIDKGYGNLLENMTKVIDGYEIIKRIVSVQKADDLRSVLKNADELDKRIKELDYSDKSVKKKTVSYAMQGLKFANDKLKKVIAEYAAGEFGDLGGVAEKFIKKFTAQCPVDFTVYDMDGNTLGYVKDGEVYYDEKILIETSGDVKTVYIPAGIDIRMDFVATGDGEWNYVVEEILDGKRSGRINFYNLPLTKGATYTQTITSDSLTGDVQQFPLQTGDGEVVYADEYLSASDQNASVTINGTADEGGIVIGAGKYPKGDPVELLAVPADDTYSFYGWYVNGCLAELESVYCFTALEDADIHAAFKKIPVLSQDYTVTLGNGYESFARVDVYENRADVKDIALRLYGAEAGQNCRTVTVKKYSSDDNCFSSEALETESANGVVLWLRGVDLSGCAKAELIDSSGEQIAVLSRQETEDLTYIVVFDLQGRGTVLPEYTGADYTDLKKGSMVKEPTTPTADGYRFTGWYKEATCMTLWDFASDTVNGDTTLYAGWEEAGKDPESITFTVTFDLQGRGTALPEYTGADYRNIPKRSIVKEPTAPTADGYIFTGWYKEAACTTLWDFKKDTLGEDIILYAGWKEAGKEPDDPGEPDDPAQPDDPVQSLYIVTFDLRGKGTALPEYASADYTDLKKGSTVKVPTAPTADGYIFTGWYKDSACTVLWDFAKDTVEEDTTLYAGWTPESEYEGVVPGDTLAVGERDGFWIAVVKEQTYTGKAIKPEVHVYDQERRLEEGRDYTLTYKNNVKVPVASGKKSPCVTVKGTGSYKGTYTVTFTIGKATLDESHLVYTAVHPKGKAYTPAVIRDGILLKAKTDYVLTYENNDTHKVTKKAPTKEGGYTMHVSGKGSCTGAFSVPYEVTAKDASVSITKAKAVMASMTYRGATPKPTLTIKKVGTLKEGTDYTVRYSNTNAKGTATAIFTGIGNYSGVLKKTFKVNAALIADKDITVAKSAPYQKSGAKPEISVTVDGVKLTMGVDYTVSYKNNKKAGKTATVTIKGKGNYSGKVTRKYQVTAAETAAGAAKNSELLFVYTKPAATIS